jgi:hypothetical protein
MIHREVVRNRYIDAYRPDTAGAGSPQGAERGAGLVKVTVRVADEKVVVNVWRKISHMFFTHGQVKNQARN